MRTKVTRAGFEPAPPKRKELESSALDHSAIVSHDIGLIAQSVERRSDKAKALGSSPSGTTFAAPEYKKALRKVLNLRDARQVASRSGSNTRASLAQSVERKTLNLVVAGSSPAGGAFWYVAGSSTAHTQTAQKVSAAGIEPATL